MCPHKIIINLTRSLAKSPFTLIYLFVILDGEKNPFLLLLQFYHGQFENTMFPQGLHEGKLLSHKNELRGIFSAFKIPLNVLTLCILTKCTHFSQWNYISILRLFCWVDVPPVVYPINGEWLRLFIKHSQANNLV